MEMMASTSKKQFLFLRTINALLVSPPKSISNKYEVLYHHAFLLGDAKVVAVDFRRGRRWFSADIACGRLPQGLAELSFLPHEGGSPNRRGNAPVGGRASKVRPWWYVLVARLRIRVGR
jgi:hypothetical protein